MSQNNGDFSKVMDLSVQSVSYDTKQAISST